MATYYIRPWGNNNNNGTSKESAWRTFAYAIANSVVNDIIDSEGYYNEGVSISSNIMETVRQHLMVYF